jgi:hypothetical protein
VLFVDPNVGRILTFQLIGSINKVVDDIEMVVLV